MHNCCWQNKIYSRFIPRLLRAEVSLLIWNRSPERHCPIAESENLHHINCSDTDIRKCPVGILREKQARKYSNFDLVSDTSGTGEKFWVWTSRKLYRSLPFWPRSCVIITTQYKHLYQHRSHIWPPFTRNSDENHIWALLYTTSQVLQDSWKKTWKCFSAMYLYKGCKIRNWHGKSLVWVQARMEMAEKN